MGEGRDAGIVGRALRAHVFSCLVCCVFVRVSFRPRMNVCVTRECVGLSTRCARGCKLRYGVKQRHVRF